MTTLRVETGSTVPACAAGVRLRNDALVNRRSIRGELPISTMIAAAFHGIL